jgi:hypothetical protein
MVTSISAITALSASANSGKQAIWIYVAPPHVQFVPSSRHRSKWASPILAERKFQFSLVAPACIAYPRLLRSFGKGVYTSSASNKCVPWLDIIHQSWNNPRSAKYTHSRVMFLTKVVLGRVFNATQFNEVMSCPPGFNSVSLIYVNKCNISLRPVCRLSSTGTTADQTRQ